MDSSFYKTVMGAIQDSSKISHRIPSHNLITLENLVACSCDLDSFETDEISKFDDSEKFLSQFPCYNSNLNSDLPRVINCGCGITDVAEDFVQKKREWSRREKLLRPKNVKNALASFRKFRNSKNKMLPFRVFLYAHHLSSEPVPSFTGDYNWLYSGGNITSIQREDKTVLFGADGPNQSILSVIVLNKNHEVIDKIDQELKIKQPILQISNNVCGNVILIFVRQKNNLSLWSLDENLKIVKGWKKKLSQNKMITSSNINGRECAGLVECQGKITLYDVETGMTLWSNSVDISNQDDAFSQMIFGKDQLYITNRTRFSGFDVRTKGTNPCLSYTPGVIAEPCEQICNTWLAEEPTSYLALTHNLLELDLRCSKHVQRWTHLLTQQPQFGCSVQLDGRDVIILQSRDPEEVVAISNDLCPESGVRVSSALPRVMTSVLDTLWEANYAGYCLGPWTSARLKATVTGACLTLKSDGSFTLFTANSVGDVFASRLSTQATGSMNVEEAVQTMAEYEKHCAQLWVRSEKTLYASYEFCKDTMTKEQLRNSALRVHKYEVPEMEWRLRELCSVKSLLQYKDVMARRILPLWRGGRDSEEEEDIHPAMVVDGVEERVKNWLRTHQD